MGVHHVVIEEIVSKQFVVEAAEEENAATFARERYRSGEFILDSGELQAERMSVIYDEGKLGVWEDI